MENSGARAARNMVRELLRWLATGTRVAALAGFLPLAVNAQSTAASSAGQAEGAQSAGTLSEVVVTAQKRTERALTIPASVTALSEGELTRIAAVRLADYQALVPGLELVADREGQTQIVIRGITTGQMTPNSTVSTYVDDAPYGSSTAFSLGGQLTPDIDPSDLQRIEVLRGPQGTLYGASALGGLVKYVTTLPDLEHYAARVEMDGSSIDHGGIGYGARGMANLPLINDTLGLRISAFDRWDPGYIDNPQLGRSDVNSTHVDGGRASVLWDATPQLNVRLTAQLQDLKGSGSDDEDVDGTTLKPLYGNLEQRRYANEPLDIRYRLYSANVNYDMGWAALTSITSYGIERETQIADLTDTYGPLLGPALQIPDLGVAFVTPIDVDKITEEFRVASPTGTPLEWQAGAFFTHEKSSHGEQFDPFETGTGAAIPVNLLSGFLLSRYTEYAGFGDVTYHFTRRFDVQGGLRYSTNSQTYSQPQSGLLIGAASTLVAESSDHSTTFLVTPRFSFDPNNMIYLRVASGYRPGGPNPLTPREAAAGVPTAFKPDTLTNYEIGYKATLRQQRLTLDVAAFYIDWRNIQLQTAFDGFDATGNGGTARSDGVEAAATFSPIQGLNFSGNVTYTSAELTQNASGIDGKSGDELPNVPKWAAHLGADYDFPITALSNGFVGAGVRYLGDRTSGFVGSAPVNYARPVIPDYTAVDLRAGFLHREWTVEVYAKNIGDVRGINNLTSRAYGGYLNPYAASIIPPRTIGISVSVNY